MNYVTAATAVSPLVMAIMAAVKIGCPTLKGISTVLIALLTSILVAVIQAAPVYQKDMAAALMQTLWVSALCWGTAIGTAAAVRLPVKRSQQGGP